MKTYISEHAGQYVIPAKAFVLFLEQLELMQTFKSYLPTLLIRKFPILNEHVFQYYIVLYYVTVLYSVLL